MAAINIHNNVHGHEDMHADVYIFDSFVSLNLNGNGDYLSIFCRDTDHAITLMQKWMDSMQMQMKQREAMADGKTS